MQESLTHQENGNNYENQTHKRISQLSYTKNLEINFINNKNLKGKNIDRAIRDFEGVLKVIEKDHAIVHYCFVYFLTSFLRSVKFKKSLFLSEE